MRFALIVIAWSTWIVSAVLLLAIFKSFFTDVDGLLIGGAPVTTDRQRFYGIAMFLPGISVSTIILIWLRSLRFTLHGLLAFMTLTAIGMMSGGILFYLVVGAFILLPFYLLYRSIGKEGN